MRALISMPEKFLAEIDKIAEMEDRTRSELIREALRLYIRKRVSLSTNTAIKNAEMLEKILE